jgi:hypothetical protein
MTTLIERDVERGPTNPDALTIQDIEWGQVVAWRGSTYYVRGVSVEDGKALLNNQEWVSVNELTRAK